MLRYGNNFLDTLTGKGKRFVVLFCFVLLLLQFMFLGQKHRTFYLSSLSSGYILLDILYINIKCLRTDFNVFLHQSKMLLFGRGHSVKFTILRFMQNSNLFESGLFISNWFAHRKILLSKSKECRIAAAIILPCLICLKLVSFTLDCQEKREKNGNRS